jgi:LPXTG-site transpeptidase (sortase) family protein
MRRLLLFFAIAAALAGCAPPPRAQPAAPSSAIEGRAGGNGSAVASGSSAPAASTVASSSPSAVSKPRPALPTELVIPAIQVDAPVEHVGTTSNGAMDVPKEWNDVAWFKDGFRPGEPGGAVIAGHLDSTTDRAVFWDLNKLVPGDKVLLRKEDGSQLTFAVVGSEVYAFDQAPLQRIFGQAEQPMLNLVTCNGTFDRGAKNYDKRLVVYTKQALIG